MYNVKRRARTARGGGGGQRGATLIALNRFTVARIVHSDLCICFGSLGPILRHGERRVWICRQKGARQREALGSIIRAATSVRALTFGMGSLESTDFRNWTTRTSWGEQKRDSERRQHKK